MVNAFLYIEGDTLFITLGRVYQFISGEVFPLLINDINAM